MSKAITQFKGDTFWLSNFYDSPVSVDGITYRNSEAAYQAQKLERLTDRYIFQYLSAKTAREFGQTVKLREDLDWNENRVRFMRAIVLNKFENNAELTRRLLATGDAFLSEGFDFEDSFWGMNLETGEGENWMGKILMETRDYLNWIYKGKDPK